MRLGSNSSQCERVLWVICHFRLLPELAGQSEIYSIIGDAPFLMGSTKRGNEWKREYICN